MNDRFGRNSEGAPVSSAPHASASEPGAPADAATLNEQSEPTPQPVAEPEDHEAKLEHDLEELAAKAQKADELGNLTYRLAARNFNPIMAKAAKFTIVEVEEIVPVGAIPPEDVITPAIFVHRIVQAKGMRFAG